MKLSLNKLIWLIHLIITLTVVSFTSCFAQYQNKDLAFADIKFDEYNVGYPKNNFNVIGKDIPITGDIGQLKYFFEALNKSKKEKIRIAHYGDSLIMGDVVTSGIREFFQEKFGGYGVGFLSITSDDIKMKQTINQDFSDDWNEASIFKRNPNDWPFGINASVFVPSNSSRVSFETSNFPKAPLSFNMVRLFYSNGNNGEIKYKFNTGSFETKKLMGNDIVNELTLKNDKSKSFELEVISAPETYFFGVSLEDGNGIYVDNFPIKGNSGVSLSDIPKNVLSGFNSLMNYKLIIISFGINVLSPTHSDYDWYEKRMIKVINYFKQAFPETSFLLVSSGDKAIKKGTRFVTDPGLSSLLKAQKNIAEKSHIAFWNLYEAMGGENSIITWVNAGPPLAHRDYCHLTYEGGDLVAKLLSKALMDKYQNFK